MKVNIGEYEHPEMNLSINVRRKIEELHYPRFLEQYLHDTLYYKSKCYQDFLERMYRFSVRATIKTLFFRWLAVIFTLSLILLWHNPDVYLNYKLILRDNLQKYHDPFVVTWVQNPEKTYRQISREKYEREQSKIVKKECIKKEQDRMDMRFK